MSVAGVGGGLVHQNDANATIGSRSRIKGANGSVFALRVTLKVRFGIFVITRSIARDFKNGQDVWSRL